MDMVSQNELNKRNYYRHKQNGECPRCGKPLDRDGHYCKKCLEKYIEYQRENRKFYREHHLCVVCGKIRVPKGERICPECRAKNANRRKLSEEQRIKANENHKKSQKLIYMQRAENGICTRCGKRKAAPGKKKCEICLQKDAEVHRRKNMCGINIREYRKENRLCYFCGNLIDVPSGQICSQCRIKFQELQKGVSHKNEYWSKDNRIIFRKRN